MTSDQKLSPEKEEQKDSVLSAANGDIEIFADIPLPHLNKNTIQAFKATGKNRIYENLICYVCDKNLTPRHLSEPKFDKINNLNLVKLVTSQVVKWNDGEEKFCFFYEAPIGQPLIHENDQSPALGWKPDEVMAQIVNPVLSILSDMRDKDLVHGEVWPGNLHFEEEKSGKHILLGECLSVPASYNLPFLYEPVERALADPIGRGAGTIADDLYSFGVSLAVILRTTDPMAGASKEEIIRHKIEKGTYSTLIGKDRFSGAMLELLRGLLYDDAAQRWTLEDIMEWRDGRRLTPKQSTKRINATRPINFNNDKYVRPELLAQDLREKPSEVIKIIENGELEQWIERAIEDRTVKSRVEQMMKYLPTLDRGNWYNDQVTAMLAATLYPDCPVRYKKISFHLAGFGQYFTHKYIEQDDIQSFTDIIKIGLLIKIINDLKQNPILTTLRGRFDAARTYLSQGVLGSGIERCLYALNPESRCLSPVLEKFYVRTPEEMMRAFETVCKGDPNAVLFDRHTAAFLSLKDKKNIDTYLSSLRSKEVHQRVLGQIRILSTIQRRSNLERFPNIAEWIASNLNQVYSQFHDAKKREKLKKHINKIKKKGDLTEISALFDDPNLYQGDILSFHAAMKQFKNLEKEKKRIEDDIKKGVVGRNSGHQVSSAISILISLIIVVSTIYLKLVVG